MAENIGRYSLTERMATDVGRHTTDIPADEQHGITSVAFPGTVAPLGLRRGAVNDCYEVIGYDDSVLASLLGILRDDALLYDFHDWCLV